MLDVKPGGVHWWTECDGRNVGDCFLPGGFWRWQHYIQLVNVVLCERDRWYGTSQSISLYWSLVKSGQIAPSNLSCWKHLTMWKCKACRHRFCAQLGFNTSWWAIVLEIVSYQTSIINSFVWCVGNTMDLAPYRPVDYLPVHRILWSVPFFYLHVEYVISTKHAGTLFVDWEPMMVVVGSVSWNSWGSVEGDSSTAFINIPRYNPHNYQIHLPPTIDVDLFNPKIRTFSSVSCSAKQYNF